MTVTIELSEGQAERLAALADRLGMTLDALASRAVHRLADGPGPAGPAMSFPESAEYVLTKNEELYRRLAK